VFLLGGIRGLSPSDVYMSDITHIIILWGMNTKTKVLVSRFLRAFIAGFASTVTVVSIQSVTTWADLGTALNAILLAGVIGGISGVLMALEKWTRWVD
jgi:hypothetical protein